VAPSLVRASTVTPSSRSPVSESTRPDTLHMDATGRRGVQEETSDAPPSRRRHSLEGSVLTGARLGWGLGSESRILNLRFRGAGEC